MNGQKHVSTTTTVVRTMQILYRSIYSFPTANSQQILILLIIKILAMKAGGKKMATPMKSVSLKNIFTVHHDTVSPAYTHIMPFCPYTVGSSVEITQLSSRQTHPESISLSLLLLSFHLSN